MKVGDLVRPKMSCGGQPGQIRCETALVVGSGLSHYESVQVDSQAYRDKEVYEYAFLCNCGTFEGYGDYMEVISESR